MCGKFNYYGFCIFTTIWTVLHSVAHMSMIIHIYFIMNCQLYESNILSSISYITYFHQSKCGNLVPLNSDEIEGPALKNLFMDDDGRKALTELYNDVIQDNSLPSYSKGMLTIQVFFILLFICDCLWIVSAVALLMGTICRIKGKWVLFFSGPYLATSVGTFVIDVVASTFFGLDALKTNSVSKWLSFIDAKNVDAEDYPSVPSTYLSLPSIIIAVFCLRLIAVWVVNLFCVLFVTKATAVSYKQSFRTEKRWRSNVINSTTSAARIRTWQLFYGAIESTSSRSSNDSKAINLNAVIHNQSHHSDIQSISHIPKECNTSSVLEDSIAIPTDVSTKPTSYRCYPFVDNVEMDGLRAQKPWTYIHPSDNSTLCTPTENTTEQSVSILIKTARNASKKHKIRFNSNDTYTPVQTKNITYTVDS